MRNMNINTKKKDNIIRYKIRIERYYI